ncbi:7714_t:CDS:1, partial [Racocetra fulgida]
MPNYTVEPQSDNPEPQSNNPELLLKRIRELEEKNIQLDTVRDH